MTVVHTTVKGTLKKNHHIYAVLLYYTPARQSCLTDLNNIGWAIWTVLAGIKKYSFSLSPEAHVQSYLTLRPPVTALQTLKRTNFYSDLPVLRDHLS